ncbi:MAG: diguanylate cyclase [Candidatus Sericytochromatia bacterium]|nr:diguanylate cyclase [Candidatus Sericytochromatia bacterium]
MVSRDLSLFRFHKTAVRGYVYAIVGAAIMALLLSIGSLDHEMKLIGSGGFVFLLALNMAAEATYVTLPSGCKITASFLVLLISSFLLSPAVTALLAAFGTGFSVIAQQRRHWSIALFNASQYTIAYIFAGNTLRFFGPDPMHFSLLQLFWAACLASIVYLFLSSLIVNGLIALREDRNVFLLIWEEDRWEWLQVVLLWPIAVLAVYLWPTASWLGVLVPFALTLIFIDALKAFIATAVFNKHLEQLQAISRLVGGAREVDNIWRTLSQRLPSLVAHERFDVYRVDDAKQRLTRVSSDLIGAPDEVYDLLDMSGPLQRAVAHRQGVQHGDLPGAKPYGELWADVESVLAVPVFVTNDVKWLLCLTSSQRRAFSTEHMHLLTLLIKYVEVTLDNVQLNQDIQQQAITDALTSLYNRRYLTKKVDDELRRAMRHRRPTSLLLIDVDFFKRFNDTHGHLLGHVVLRDLGGLLLDAVRDTDVVARYGGEEFAVFLPETSLEHAVEVAERIRVKVATHPFQGRNSQTVSCTLSIGASCSEDATMTREELIDFADTALYRAKKQGRNQICQSQSVSGDSKAIVVGTFQEQEIVEKAMATGHRIDAKVLERWATQLKAGVDTVARQWHQGVERFPSSGERQAMDETEGLATVEQIVEVIVERLLVIVRRPEGADRGFATHGLLFDQLRKEARRAAHHPHAILRLETNLLLCQSALQTFCSGFEGDRSLLRLLIDRLMIAIHTVVTDAWLEHVSQSQQDLQVLLRGVQKLNRLADVAALADVGAGLLLEAMACDATVYATIQGDDLIIRGRAGLGAPATGERLSRSPVEAIRRGDAPAAVASPWSLYAGDLIVVPLALRDERALLIGWGPSPRHFRLEEMRLAEVLATQIAATQERLHPWEPVVHGNPDGAGPAGEPTPTP